MVSTSNDDSSSSVEEVLYGNTLSVYWFMVRVSRPYRAREIQRRVGLSSNSLALHHLKKLMDLGFVDTDEFGSYVVTKRARSGLLGLFIGSGWFFVPRHLIYAAACTGFLIPYLAFLTLLLNPAGVVLLIGQIIVTLVFWLETIKIWKLQPV